MNSVSLLVAALVVAPIGKGEPGSALPFFPTDSPVMDLFTGQSRIMTARTIGEFGSDLSHLIDADGKVQFNNVVVEWAPLQSFCPKKCPDWLTNLALSLGTGVLGQDTDQPSSVTDRIGVGLRWAPIHGTSPTTGGHLGLATAAAFDVKNQANLNARLAQVNAYLSGGYGWTLGKGWIEIIAGTSLLANQFTGDQDYAAGVSVLLGAERVHIDLETGYHAESLYSLLSGEYMVFSNWWLQANVQAYWMEDNKLLPGQQILSTLTFGHHFENTKPEIGPIDIQPTSDSRP